MNEMHFEKRKKQRDKKLILQIAWTKHDKEGEDDRLKRSC